MTSETIAELPSAVYVRERLDYDPETGVFLWWYCAAMGKRWNTRYAGTVAGCINSDGYRRIGIDGVRHQAHRLAWLIVHGDWPADQIDHINGVRDDNRIANLRVVTSAENLRNQSMYASNISGHMGVCWHKGAKKWVAYITVDQVQIYLGLFPDLADAIAARKAAETDLGFHANHGRTPVKLAR